ncbi:MAG: ABC transporter permease [Balneolaceae bacterium]|nr:ABC transporter permease [Balneolaceae bacterium]MBO6545715.1 ABC transporter permease [Balneolaceae bacterium]MBO6647111.1 ABC transporter permease [Balneolaceae bacterium]
MDNTGFIARRYLFSRKHISLISTLTYISIAGVTIGTALLIVVLSVFNGFFDVIKNLLLSYDPDIRIESASGTVFTENQQLLDELNSIPEVKIYSPYVEGKALLSYGDDRNTVVDVRGIDTNRFFELVNIKESVTSGVFEVAVRNRKPGVVIPEQIRSDMLLGTGDDIALLSASGMKKALTQITVPRSYRFDVRGSYFLQQVADGPQVFVDMKAAQRLFNARNGISGIDIKLNDNEEAESVKKTLQARLGDEYSISTWYDLQKPLYDVMNLEKWAAYVILMIIVVVAVLNIIGSLTMIVIQKRRDIGILVSMGYSKARIKSIFRKQGLYIGLIGCGIGGSIGFLLCWLQQEFGIIKLSSAFIINAYPVDVQLMDVTIVLLGSLFLCLAASWFPSKRASEIQPAEAIRYE